MADVATNAFPVGNVTVKGILGCTVAGSFSARLRLTNGHMAPVSNMADTENPWVWTGKYNRPLLQINFAQLWLFNLPCLPYSHQLRQFPCSFSNFMPRLLSFAFLLLGGGF